MSRETNKAWREALLEKSRVRFLPWATLRKNQSIVLNSADLSLLLRLRQSASKRKAKTGEEYKITQTKKQTRMVRVK